MVTNRLPESRLSETESRGVITDVKGIVNDLETLAQQHIRLFKKDIQEDIHKLQEGAVFLGSGLGIALVGALLLGIALAEGILLLFDNPAAYRWLAYGLVGLLITGAGVGFLMWGQKEVKDSTPVADRTREALEEDAQWLKRLK